MFDDLRRRIARAIAPPRGQTRAYAAARQTRLTAGWYAPNNSSDSELAQSLTLLRARSRALCRDAPYAKRARMIVVNNVVGSGIDMEPKVVNQRGVMQDSVNDAIEEAWCEWSRPENCHTGGKLHFADIERQAMAQIFEAGEVFFRKHYTPFGSSSIPFALELIESERIADEFTVPSIQQPELYRLGIERDEFGRPIAFYVRRYHPGDLRFVVPGPDLITRVDASQMMHLYVCDRWPQTRGEPWLHAVARRLNDMDGYSEAEITAARGAAAYMATIESPEDPQWDDGTTDQAQFEIEPGLVQELSPGQKLNFTAPNRPNPNMDPFMRMMLREVASGCGVSYESLSRDYSQSNYSSSRLALLDDRDLWRVMQQWFIRSFREPLHREWLQQAVLARAIPSIPVADYVANRTKFEAVSFKPRGWSWVDPTKEVEAYKAAVRAGFMSVSRVVALTGDGADLEDIWSEREQEIQMAKDKGLTLTTDPAVILERSESDATATPPAATPDAEDAPVDGEGARVVNLR